MMMSITEKEALPKPTPMSKVSVPIIYKIGGVYLPSKNNQKRGLIGLFSTQANHIQVLLFM